MNTILQTVVIVAALLFIAVSGVMNALFLSSLGRNGTEVLLLGAVSVAGDLVKAVLPIALMRAITLRALMHGGVAAAMLVMVIALSLASGTGFAALTRGTTTALREARADKLSDRQREMHELELRLAALPASRPAALIEVEMAGMQTDRRRSVSGGCRETAAPATRTFCAAYLKLRAELEAAKARADLDARLAKLRDHVEALRADGGMADSDPQAGAIAELLGVDQRTVRIGLTMFVAVVLELGSVVLILLAAGPTLCGWREPGEIPATPMVPAGVPEQADRTHWRRQREKHVSIGGQRMGTHVQQ